jgi:hypothetical protein
VAVTAHGISSSRLTHTMAPLRCIHIGVGGRGAWPVQVISQRDDYQSVALVDVDQPARSDGGGISRPSGREQMAAAQKVSGLGDAVCFLGPAAGTQTSHLEQALAAVECDDRCHPSTDARRAVPRCHRSRQARVL